MKGPYELFIKIMQSYFQDKLKRDKSVTIHHRNIQSLAIKTIQS